MRSNKTRTLTRKQQVDLLRETSRKLGYALDAYSDLSWDLHRLTETIKDQEKQHNRGRPSGVRAKPLTACVNYFIVKTIDNALETIGKRKTLSLQAVNVRSDYLLALKLVASLRNYEDQNGTAILSRELKREIAHCASVTDYCEL